MRQDLGATDRFRRAAKAIVAIAVVLTCLSVPACSVEIPQLFGLPDGPFLLKGTFVRVERFFQPACFAWEGDNGIFYHLFQDVNLDDELFDMATTENVRSRLLLEIRSDLEVSCQLGPVVEVLEVRDIIGGI